MIRVGGDFAPRPHLRKTLSKQADVTNDEYEYDNLFIQGMYKITSTTSTMDLQYLPYQTPDENFNYYLSQFLHT